LYRAHEPAVQGYKSGAMYLNSVLQSISQQNKVFAAEDLYKLNEAIFNLPEEDSIDTKTSAKLFKAMEKIYKSYNSGRYDQSDPNFFYDYVALLSTMQNQHFFNAKQSNSLLEWLSEAVEPEDGTVEPLPKESKAASKAASATNKEIARLEDENAKLAAEIAKMKELSSAVQTIQSFKLPPSMLEKPKPKAKAKAKAKAKGKAKGKGKGKEEEETTAETTAEEAAPKEEAGEEAS